MIWLWCKWGMDWRRGCGKIRGGRSGCGARDEKWWWLGAPGSESLRSGQKNGLDLCMSNNFISMGGVGGEGTVPTAAPCFMRERVRKW